MAAVFNVETKGSNGAAVGTRTIGHTGLINAITVEFLNSVPDTTRVRIYMIFGELTYELVDYTGNDNTLQFPSIPLQDESGTEVGRTVPFSTVPIFIDVSGSNAANPGVRVSLF